MLTNFIDKENYFFNESRNFLDEKLDDYFKEFKVNVSEVGSCPEEKCNLTEKYCFEINNISVTFEFEIKILSFIHWHTSTNPLIHKTICVEIGPVLYSTEEKAENNSFDISIYGDENIDGNVESEIHIPFDSCPVRLSFYLGLVGTLGSGKAGVKLSLYLKDKFSIDLFYEFRDFELSSYLMATFTFDISIIKFSFSFYIYRYSFVCSKVENHISKEYKYSTALVNENDKVVFNGDKWEQKYSNTTNMSR